MLALNPALFTAGATWCALHSPGGWALNAIISAAAHCGRFELGVGRALWYSRTHRCTIACALLFYAWHVYLLCATYR